MDYAVATVEQLLASAEQADPADADAMLADAIARYPDELAPYAAYARRASNGGDWMAALQRWQAVAAQFNAVPDGFCGATHALMELGRFDEARAVLAPALKLFPNDRWVAVINGWLATRRRDIKAAEAIWADVRDRFPDEHGGYMGCAAALRDEGRLDEAESLLLEAAKKFPDAPYIAMDLAQLLGDRRNWPAAIAQWQAVLRRFPHEPRAYIGLGEALIAAEDHAAAKVIYETGMQQCPDDFHLAAAAAWAAVVLYGVPEAVSLWSELIRRYPGNPQAYIGCGRAMRDGGQFDLSLDQLNAGLARFPDNFELELQIALTLSAKRDWPRALALWDSLKRRYPGNGAVRSCITSILWQAGQDQLAGIAEGGEAPFEIPQIVLDNRIDDHGEADAMKTLFGRFESIGDTCEFGIVQRRYGAEPLSLLRWTSTPPDQLISALDSDFAGVGDPEHTVVEITRGEFTTYDRRYVMHSHTFTPASSDTLENFTAQHLRRMQFLRRKFLDDLRGAKKLLVYKSSDGLSDMQVNAIHDALLRFHPKITLLCVRLETPANPSGTVDQWRDGLFAGYIDKFSTVDISMKVWVGLCRRVAELHAAAQDMRAVA